MNSMNRSGDSRCGGRHPVRVAGARSGRRRYRIRAVRIGRLRNSVTGRVPFGLLTVVWGVALWTATVVALWTVLGVLGVWAAAGPSAAVEPAGPVSAAVRAAGDEDEPGGESRSEGLPLEVDRRVPLDMTEGS